VVQKGPGWEKGREELRTKDPAELARRENFVTGELLDVSELELEGLEQPLQAELDSFLRCVATGSPPEVTGHDGRRALDLAEKITTAIREQRW
jgi:predicted dehydrogenase